MLREHLHRLVLPPSDLAQVLAPLQLNFGQSCVELLADLLTVEPALVRVIAVDSNLPESLPRCVRIVHQRPSHTQQISVVIRREEDSFCVW